MYNNAILLYTNVSMKPNEKHIQLCSTIIDIR